MLHSDLYRRSLKLFLPISGAITLVLLPMVGLYEHSRRETLEGRVASLVQASTVQVQLTLQEARANTGVVTTVSPLTDLLNTAAPSPQQRRRMEGVFRAQLREYERFYALAVYGSEGQALALVSRAGFNLPNSVLRQALAQTQALQPRQVWVSSVQWPAQRPAEVLITRPLFSVGGQRRGVLLAVVNLGRLARDFNQITNTAPDLQRGFLLSGEGRTINAPPGGAAGLNFAARYPAVWQQMQRQPKGLVDTGNGLFFYITDPLRPPASRSKGEGLFLFERGRAKPHLAVVIQVPPNSLYRSSVFSQPAGQALVALVYLLAGGVSTAIALHQQHQDEDNDKVRELQARLQAVVQNAGVGMCLCDSRSGRFLSVNDALCQFFRRREADLLACTWQEITHPDDLAADQRLAEQLQHGELDSYRMRKRFVSADGSTIWGDLVVSCTRNEDGTVRDLIGQITDVSELVAKTTYLETASSAGVVGVWDWDVASNRLTWDAVMLRLYGLPPDPSGISYALWEQAVHPSDRSRAVEELQASLSGEKPFDCQFRVVWPNGSVHDIRARANVEFNREGRPQRVVGVNYEVTEQVRKSAYLEAASSAGVVGVWDWDIPRDVLTWDAVMYRLYGLRAEDFKGTREAWEASIHPDDKPFVVQELQAALRGWLEYQPRFRVVWPDGSIHYLQARSRTTYGPDGTALNMIGVNYDVTTQVEREQELEQQRQFLATTLDALVDPLLVLTLADRSQLQNPSPPQLYIAEINAAATRFFSSSHQQLIGQPLDKLLPVSLNSALHAALQTVAQGGPALVADAQPARLSAGAEPMVLDLRAACVRQGVVLSFRDVSEQQRSAARLAESEQRYRLLAENASDVVFSASLEGVTEWITPSVTPLLGWAPADLVQRPFAPFVHPADLGLLQEADAAFAAGKHHQFRMRVLRRDGDYRWVSVHARGLMDDNGAVVGIIGGWRDAQTDVENEAELDRRARIDPLTGLYNRREILEQLERLTRRLGHRHADQPLAVLFCEIDHFKAINDGHGHAGGDAVLQALAQRLRASTRLNDLVGRLGGDELLIVLQAISSLQDAVATATKIHAAAREPLQLPTGEVVPTLSIGVTLINADESIDAVVARADQAMYAAKTAGRNRVVAF